MRRRLSILVAATTSAVVLAFLIPLALLLRTLAETRALNDAETRAQNLAAAAVAITDQARLNELVSSGGAQTTTVMLTDGTEIGLQIQDPNLQRARQTGSNFTVPVPAGPGQGAGRAVYVPAAGPLGTVAVRVFVPEAALHEGVNRSTLIISGLAALSLIAAVIAADQLARRVSAPILDVANAANALREGYLDTRAPEEGTKEVVALARALNGLAARITQLLASERDAVADLSHRLRTPVTALRLDADGVSDPDLADRLRIHVAHLERTVDAVVRDLRRPVRTAVNASCDLCPVVADRVSFWSALAYDQGRVLNLTMPNRPVRGRIQASDLTDVVDVLIDNAFAHTAEGVRIEVSVGERLDGSPALTVEDAGPGLPSGDVVKRGASGAGSTGLGLDIVRRAALASGGSLELGRSRLGGAFVQVSFGRVGY